MPIDRVNQRIDVAFVPIRAATDAPQNATREPRFEVCVHRQCQIAGERDAAVGGNDIGCADLRELLGQDRFEAARAGSKVALGHGTTEVGDQNGFITTRNTIATRIGSAGISFSQR